MPAKLLSVLLFTTSLVAGSTVLAEYTEVTGPRFPEGSEHVQGELEQYIREGLPTWDVDFSLDNLLTSLEASEEEIAAANNLKIDPPDIVYRDHPALLVTMDGEPVLREFENTDYQAAICSRSQRTSVYCEK